MRTFVGIDIAKEVHWVCAIELTSAVVLSLFVTKGVYFFLYSLSWSRQGDFSLRGTLAWRLTGAPISDPADRKRRLYLQLVEHL